MLSYRAVSHFDSQASVVTRTLSEAECSKNRWLKIVLAGVKKSIMSHARFTESCVLTGFFKHFKGGNFVASRKTHSLIFVASTDELTGSKRKKRALAETLEPIVNHSLHCFTYTAS